MSFEQDLARDLRARGASVRATPDVEDLATRLRLGARRTERRNRTLVMSCALVLAACAGGLVGALASRPPQRTAVVNNLNGVTGGNSSVQSGPMQGRSQDGAKGPTGAGSGSPGPFAGAPLATYSLRVGSVIVRARERPLPGLVAVTAHSAAGDTVTCSQVAVVTTTVSRPGSFAGGTGIVGLPVLGPSGLEIVESGALPASSGAVVWWLTATVGSQVARVAAQLPGGQVVTGQPSNGLVVLAGTEPAGAAAPASISAVAESDVGHPLTSIGVSVGSPPVAGGEVIGQLPRGCSVLRLPDVTSITGAPLDPSLTAALVITTIETEHPSGYDIRQVSFLSATRAEVIYRARSTVVWQTATAVADSAGRWSVKFA